MNEIRSAANSSLIIVETVTVCQNLDCGIIICGIIENEITDFMVLWPARRLLAVTASSSLIRA
jgi:hypothetical protein